MNSDVRALNRMPAEGNKVSDIVDPANLSRSQEAMISSWLLLVECLLI